MKKNLTPKYDIKYLLEGRGQQRDSVGQCGTVVQYDFTFKDGFHMKRKIPALKLYCRHIK